MQAASQQTTTDKISKIVESIFEDADRLDDIMATITSDFEKIRPKIPDNDHHLLALYNEYFDDFYKECHAHVRFRRSLDKPIQAFLRNIDKQTVDMKRRFLDFMKNYYDFHAKKLFYFFSDLRMNHLNKMPLLVKGRMTQFLQPHQFATSIREVRNSRFQQLDQRERTFMQQLKRRTTNPQNIQKMQSLKDFIPVLQASQRQQRTGGGAAK